MTKRGQGFTLIEMIMAIVITGLVASVFAVVINEGLGSWFFIKGQKGLLMESRAALNRLLREIRLTRNAADGIRTFTASQYEFIDLVGQEINYQQAGANLERNGIAILTNLASPGGLSFVYLNSHGSQAVLAEEVRSIQVTLTVEEGDNFVRLRGAAGLRNR